MARTLLLLPPLLLILAAGCFDNSMAISCFSRNGNSSTSNGTTLSCGGSTTHCYSFSDNGEQFAGCNTINMCSLFTASSTNDCRNCSTDYCNSMTPSRISCFYRSGYSSNYNGTVITCHSGVSTCYSTMSSYSSTTYAGCGGCSHQNDPTCVTCEADYCNSVTPSSIRCYVNRYSYSKPPTSNGQATECPTGHTSCYSHSDFPNAYSFIGGCGACNATDDPTCATCSTDLCNTLTPSAIICNSGSKSSLNPYFSFGLKAAACPPGVTTCMSSEIQRSDFDVTKFYGCGNCSADTMPSCVTCTGDYCNDVGANTFSCYHLISGYQTSVSCTKGVSSCYNLTNPIVRSPGKGTIPIRGCGVCTPKAAALYGCTSCSTSNCNGQAASTSNPSNPWSPSNPSNSSNPSGNATSGISCYHNFGQTQQASQKKINCPTSSNCFDSTFRYGFNRFYFSGCGSCPFGSGADGSTCRTCSSDYCNSAQRLTGITCYNSFGATAASERKEVECSSSSSCFNYSYKFGVSELFFAGCGNCTFDSVSTNCRSCFTDLCNSGPGLGACSFSAAAAAAAAAFVMKFVSLL